MLGTIYGIIGLIAGALITIFGILGMTASSGHNNYAGMFLGIGAIILLPVGIRVEIGEEYR